MYADDIREYLEVLNLKTDWCDNFKALSVTRINDSVEVCKIPITPSTSLPIGDFMPLLPENLDSLTEAQLRLFEGLAEFRFWALGTFTYRLTTYKEDVLIRVSGKGRGILADSARLGALSDGEDVEVSIIGVNVFKKGWK